MQKPLLPVRPRARPDRSLAAIVLTMLAAMGIGLAAGPVHAVINRGERSPAMSAPVEVAFAQSSLDETAGELQQAVAVLPGGGFGAVWVEGSSPQRNVRMQWLDVAANPVFPPGGLLVAGTPNDESDAVIAAHETAGAYVAFRRGSDIAVQYFNAAGQPQWPGDGVLAAVRPFDAVLSTPNLVSNPAGGVFVCFQFSGAGPLLDIRCQFVDATGARRWSDSGASVGTGGDDEVRVLPRAVSDGAGGLLVFWRNQRESGAPPSVPMLMEGQRFASDGSKPWGALPRVVRTTGLAATNSYVYRIFQVVSDGSGGAVLAFNDWTGTSGPALDVIAQRVSATGDLLWGTGAVVTGAAGHQQHEQTIGAGDGGAFVAIFDQVSSTHNQLRLFRLAPDGSHAWVPEGLLLSDPGSTALDYSLFGTLDDGVLRLAWTHQLIPDTLEMDVQFVSYSPQGERAGDVWLTQANDAQFLSGLVYSRQFGGVLGLWDDRRKGTWSDLDVMGAYLAQPPAPVRSFECCGYVGETPFTVSIAATAPDGTLVQTFEDRPPAGWAVGSISHGGVFDAGTGTIRWGPYPDALPRTLTYEVTPPVSAAGSVTFGGTAGIDGIPVPITGDAVLDPDPIFADGFESGDLSHWSASSTDGGDLAVTGAAALDGSYGLSGVVDDTASLYVQDDSPAMRGSERCYRLRFLFDATAFDPGEAGGRHRVRLFLGLQTSPGIARLFAIVLRRLGGEYFVMARVRRDDGTRMNTDFFPVTAGLHSVQVEWHRASGPGASDGSFALWIDDALKSSLSNVDNDAAGIEAGRLGLMNVKPGASGLVRFDRYDSRRQLFIQP
jgi:hypothetical protein